MTVINDIWHDRRPADRQPQPEPEPFEQAPEVEVRPERMGEDIISSLRFPSAHPGEGSLIVPRVRDRDLCRVCAQPLVGHRPAGGVDWHMPEPMPSGQRTAGTHPDIEDGRARSTQPSGLEPTFRFGG